jgi:hypothetical protein
MFCGKNRLTITSSRPLPRPGLVVRFRSLLRAKFAVMPGRRLMWVVRLQIPHWGSCNNGDETWICIQKMEDRSKCQVTRFIAVLERWWVGSEATRSMALTGAMWELSSVIALCTAPRIVLESALPFQLQLVPERQELTVQGQPSGATNQLYRIKLRHTIGKSKDIEK